MNTINKIISDRTFTYGIITKGLIFFFLIGYLKITYALIIGLLIFWLLDANLLNKVKRAYLDSRFWTVSCLFWLSVIWIINTSPDNYFEALKYVEKRLPLFIFPLIFSSVHLSPSQIKGVAGVFVLSVLGVAVVGGGNSVYLYFNHNDATYFYNSNLLMLFGGQAVYYSLYVNIAIIFIVHFIRYDNRTEIIISFLLIISLLFYQFFLASRLSLVFSLFLFFLFIGKFIKTADLSGGKKYSILFFSVLILISGISYSPRMIGRFQSILSSDYDITSVEEEYNLNDEGEKINWNGLTIRLAILECAREIMKTNWLFGVGTGDYKDSLYEAYKKLGFQYGIIKKYGTHNQYMYTFIVFGAVGLLFFLISFWLLLRFSIGNRDEILVFLIILFMIGFLTENLLNRQSGIIPMSLLMSALLNKSKLA